MDSQEFDDLIRGKVENHIDPGLPSQGEWQRLRAATPVVSGPFFLRNSWALAVPILLLLLSNAFLLWKAFHIDQDLHYLDSDLSHHEHGLITERDTVVVIKEQTIDSAFYEDLLADLQRAQARSQVGQNYVPDPIVGQKMSASAITSALKNDPKLAEQVLAQLGSEIQELQYAQNGTGGDQAPLPGTGTATGADQPNARDDNNGRNVTGSDPSSLAQQPSVPSTPSPRKQWRDAQFQVMDFYRRNPEKAVVAVQKLRAIQADTLNPSDPKSDEGSVDPNQEPTELDWAAQPEPDRREALEELAMILAQDPAIIGDMLEEEEEIELAEQLVTAADAVVEKEGELPPPPTVPPPPTASSEGGSGDSDDLNEETDIDNSQNKLALRWSTGMYADVKGTELATGGTPLAPTVGAQAEVMIGRNLGLEAGVGFTYIPLHKDAQGQTVPSNFGELPEGMPNSFSETEGTLSFLEVPIKARWYFLGDKTVSPYVGAGIVNTIWTNEAYVFKQEIDTNYIFNYDQRRAGFDLIGFTGTAGCRFRLSDRMVGSLEINVLRGRNNLGTANNTMSGTGGQARFHYLLW